MLEPQVVVNLLSEFGVGVNPARRDGCFAKIVGHDAGRLVHIILLVMATCSETDEFHNSLSFPFTSNPPEPGRVLTSTSTALPGAPNIGLWSYAFWNCKSQLLMEYGPQ